MTCVPLEYLVGWLWMDLNLDCGSVWDGGIDRLLFKDGKGRSNQRKKESMYLYLTTIAHFIDVVYKSFVLLGKLYAIAVNVKSEEIYEGFCAIDISKLVERNGGRSINFNTEAQIATRRYGNE